MKRYSDGGVYGKSGGQNHSPQLQGGGKRFRGGPNDVELRLLIPSRVAGSVIGKGGSNIARLRNDFKASVTVPDCPGPERILTIFAELENGLKVIEEVLPALDEVRQKFNKARDGEGGREDYDIRLIVHQSQAGCVIGKAGSKIKDLRDKTGARIKIYSICCPQSTDRIVQVFGTAETSINCIREIMELLKTAPVKGTEIPYDPHQYDDYYADEYGGYGTGSGSGNSSNRDSPRQSRFGQPPPGNSNRSGAFPPRQGGRFDQPPGGFVADGSFGGQQGHGDMAGGQNMVRNSTQVTIPKDMAGAIIGKAGQRIRKIRLDSGAGITIDECLPGSTDRIITITGTSSQIQMAQYLLQQSVREHGHA